MSTNDERMLSVKELAGKLGRHEGYVWAMRRRGFRMIGGRTTFSFALAWLADHPQPWGKRRKTKENEGFRR